MFFIILSTLFLITPPQPDTTLTNNCQAQLIDSTTTAVFQTLNTAHQAPEQFKKNSRDDRYPTFSIFNGEHLSVQKFQDTLKCILPISQITDSTFRVGISIIENDDNRPRLLIISFFNAAGEHNLPIANFRYCVVDSSRSYEFISYKKMSD